MARQTATRTDYVPDGYELVDDRPPLCSNGCGVMHWYSDLSMECNECGYIRKVLREKTDK